ncbi:MAG: hypothetical protein EA398_12440 [Deltaproteobacteria bacterium]|nr:MAG: hypothetical protein EA398_12440 [Deltaproteobacteria bacterium]
MNRLQMLRRTGLLVAALLMAGGCQRAAVEHDPDPQVAEAEVHPQHHSPWYVSVDGDGPFRMVTFKDVGMNRAIPSPDDPMLEVIAASLAMTLATDEVLGMTTGVDYDAALVDPDEHTFCARSHLYVDLWRGEAPARWGYSLWSGCNEHDQFAWHEVPVDETAGGDVVDEVTPLTESIAGSLRSAIERDCYQRHC